MNKEEELIQKIDEQLKKNSDLKKEIDSLQEEIKIYSKSISEAMRIIEKVKKMK